MGSSYREMVGSLMWIANQTWLDVANAVRPVAPFSHDPKQVRVKAARKIIPKLAERHGSFRSVVRKGQ